MSCDYALVFNIMPVVAIAVASTCNCEPGIPLIPNGSSVLLSIVHNLAVSFTLFLQIVCSK